MAQPNPDSPKQMPGGKTFRYVQNNWNDLEKIERLGFAALIVLVAEKNRIQHTIKNFLLSIIRSL